MYKRKLNKPEEGRKRHSSTAVVPGRARRWCHRPRRVFRKEVRGLLPTHTQADLLRRRNIPCGAPQGKREEDLPSGPDPHLCPLHCHRLMSSVASHCFSMLWMVSLSGAGLGRGPQRTRGGNVKRFPGMRTSGPESTTTTT